MYCEQCGLQNDQDALYCQGCGYFLNKNEPEEAQKPNRKKVVLRCLVALCLVIVLGTGLFFGTKLILNRLSGGIANAEAPESAGSVVVDCTNISEKVTDEESAYALLNSLSDLFGFENAKDVLDIEKTDLVEGDTYYRFAQKYKGIPVYGNSVVIAADEAGKVFYVGGNYAPVDDKLSVEPKLNAEKIKKKIESQAKKELVNGLTVSEPKKLIYLYDTSSVLAWRTVISGYDKNDSFRCYTLITDSNNGNVLAKESQIIAEQIEKELVGANDGKQNVTVEKFTTTDGVTRFQLWDKARKLSVFEPIDKYYWHWNENNGIKDGKAVRQLVSWSDGEAPNKSGVDAMANVSRTYDYYSKVMHHRGMDGRGGEIPIYVNVTTETYDEDGKTKGKDLYNNAFYSPAYKIICFTMRGKKNSKGKDVPDENGIEYSANLDTVAHEYTHGVIDEIAKLRTHGIQRALHEGYADIMGECVEDSLGNIDVDWIHNKRIIESPSEPYMSVYDPNMEIPASEEYDYMAYRASTIISHAAYLMWETESSEKGAITNTETLAKLWYGSLYMLNSGSDFSDCRTAVETSALRLLAKNELTEEQVLRVSQAFDQVGIDPKLLCEVVCEDTELQVHGANDSLYYNYHCKIEKGTVRKLHDKKDTKPDLKLGLVEIDFETVDEFDITEEATVTLHNLEIPNYYRITISDLSDEPGETQTKLVVASSGSNAEAILDFYTDYVPPVGDLIERVNAALDGVKSVHLSQNSFSDYSVSGTDVNMNVNLESDANITQGTTYANMTTRQGSQSLRSEVYVETNGGTSNVYMSANGIWVKQTDISGHDLYKLGSGFEGVGGIKFYLNAMENIYIDSDSDEQNHFLSGFISSASTEEALKRAGFATIIDQLDTNDDISSSEIQSIMSNLSPMKITFLISKDTMLPVQMTIDLTSTTDSIYSNLASIASNHGESISYQINQNEVVSNFSQYNGISEIFIPDEAYQGRDYKIIS